MTNLRQNKSKRYSDSNPLQSMADQIYVGVVRNHVDPQRMGRLQVWIPAVGHDKPDHWITVSYASPLAGATPVGAIAPGGAVEDETQRSYGFWATPPHLNNRVLCCFIK